MTKETVKYFCGWCDINFTKEWYFDPEKKDYDKRRHTKCPKCGMFIPQPED